MKRLMTIWITLFLAFGCVEPFDPPVTDDDADLLVVEGFVNTTDHTASVRLSRALRLAEAAQPAPESGATVTVEETDGTSYPVADRGNGIYSASSPAFVEGKQFRIHIVTATGNEYISSYVLAKEPPPIDEITWAGESDGVTIKLSTHDDSRQTQYYRWEFQETWKYNAAFSSDWKIVNGKGVYRNVDEQIFYCYQSSHSEKILTYSTSGLSEDLVPEYEITFIPKFSQKISIHYSILVKQYALSKEAYDYWQQLKVSTETLGGLFDPQPSRVRGNIQNVNNDQESVIGYFDASGVSEQRIFIQLSELPHELQRFPRADDCVTNVVPLDSVKNLSGIYLLTSGIYSGITLIGFNYTSSPCADCRVQGGTTKKPDYWP